jgi:riboflavin kinase/FMN adenylyltransferase
MALEKGNLGEATRCLGRAYSIEGRVVSGLRRGRTLGFPTANLEPLNEQLPAPGVYATLCRTRGRRFQGATFIGPRPTFGEEQVVIETFILDTSITLYGEKLELDFIERIRGVWKFSSPKALAEQIGKDVAMAREALAGKE